MIDKRNFKVQTDKSENIFNKEFIIINLQSHIIGIQTNYLREVFELPHEGDIINIPFTPTFIKGIIKHRGEVLPVITLLEILESREKEENCTKIAVIEDKLKVAFLFHEILDVKLVDDKAIEVVKDARKQGANNYLTGYFEWDTQIVHTLDVHKLLASEIFK